MKRTERDDVVALLPALLRYARALTRDAGRAEDLVQEALAGALAHLGSRDPARPLGPWLFGIVHNRFVSDRRHDAVHDRYVAAASAETPAAATLPQELAIAVGQVERALAALPIDQREALHLVAVEELSYQDAALVLDVPIGTLMSRIARGRARLRAVFAEPKVTPLRVVGDRGHNR